MRKIGYSGTCTCNFSVCKRRQKCAVLIAGDFGVSEFLIRHIEELKMRVKVVWVGDEQLESYVLRQIRSSNSVLFFHHTESLLFFDHGLTFQDFSPVLMPLCFQFTRIQQSHLADAKKHCKYELNTFRKIVWAKLERGAPEAFGVS